MQKGRGAQAVFKGKDQEDKAGKDKAKGVDNKSGCHNIIPPFT